MMLKKKISLTEYYSPVEKLSPWEAFEMLFKLLSPFFRVGKLQQILKINNNHLSWTEISSLTKVETKRNATLISNKRGLVKLMRLALITLYQMLSMVEEHSCCGIPFTLFHLSSQINLKLSYAWI